MGQAAKDHGYHLRSILRVLELREIITIIIILSPTLLYRHCHHHYHYHYHHHHHHHHHRHYACYYGRSLVIYWLVEMQQGDHGGKIDNRKLTRQERDAGQREEEGGQRGEVELGKLERTEAGEGKQSDRDEAIRRVNAIGGETKNLLQAAEDRHHFCSIYSMIRVDLRLADLTHSSHLRRPVTTDPD